MPKPETRKEILDRICLGEDCSFEMKSMQFAGERLSSPRRAASAYGEPGRRLSGRSSPQSLLRQAAYGLAVLDDLAQRLTADFGKGFTTTNLRYMRSFYQAFSIHHALRDESRSADSVNAPHSELPAPRKRNATGSEPTIRHAGQYKQKDVDILETLADGRSRLRFKTVSARRTPKAMSELLSHWDAAIRQPIPSLGLRGCENIDD